MVPDAVSPQLIAKTGYGDVGQYDMLESPFLMYRFSDGVKLAEDLIQDLVSKHYTKFEVGDVVKHQESTGIITRIDHTLWLDQYEVTFGDTWEMLVGFNLEHASVLHSTAGVVLAAPQKYEPDEFEVDPWWYYRDDAVGDELMPIWYYDTIGGRVHIFTGVERGYLVANTVHNVTYVPKFSSDVVAKTTVDAVSTPLIALGSLGLVGAILLFDGAS